MDMGTGKTLVTIALAGALLQQGKIHKMLVVSPKSIMNVWEDEFFKFADFDYQLTVPEGDTQRKAQTIDGLKATDFLQVVVLNYESVWRLEETMLKWDADLIVCDESSKIKNPKAQCSKTLHKLGKKSRYNVILTGTPVVNNPLDFFSQYKFLDDQIFGGSFYPFRAKYAIIGGYGNHQIVGYKNLDELVGKAHSIAYRVKLTDAVDMPDTEDREIYINLEPNAARLYRQMERESYIELMSGEVDGRNVLTKLLRLSQITGGYVTNMERNAQQVSSAKLEALEDIVDSCEEEHRKVVVFVRYLPEIEAIRRMLVKKGIKYSLVCGDVKDRATEVARFQEDEDCLVFVGQLATTSMGLTLTSSCVAVFYSLDFSFANYQQSRARIFRIGQKNKCIYIHLIAKNTVDELTMKALKRKESLAKLVVDNPKQILSGGTQ
jgi:SNF2 family DNA or RNA helicase